MVRYFYFWASLLEFIVFEADRRLQKMLFTFSQLLIFIFVGSNINRYPLNVFLWKKWTLNSYQSVKRKYISKIFQIPQIPKIISINTSNIIICCPHQRAYFFINKNVRLSGIIFRFCCSTLTLLFYMDILFRYK